MILTSTIRASCWDFLSLHFMYLEFFHVMWKICVSLLNFMHLIWFSSCLILFCFFSINFPSSFSNALHICEPIKHVAQQCEWKESWSYSWKCWRLW
jgi:hypothetical protein